jgi:hypothetical protein
MKNRRSPPIAITAFNQSGIPDLAIVCAAPLAAQPAGVAMGFRTLHGSVLGFPPFAMHAVRDANGLL